MCTESVSRMCRNSLRCPFYRRWSGSKWSMHKVLDVKWIWMNLLCCSRVGPSRGYWRRWWCKWTPCATVTSTTGHSFAPVPCQKVSPKQGVSWCFFLFRPVVVRCIVSWPTVCRRPCGFIPNMGFGGSLGGLGVGGWDNSKHVSFSAT